MKDDTQNVIMWTAKEDIVLETVERDGVSFVRKEYIDKKYGETAWIFKTAYSFSAKKQKREFLSRSRQKARFGYLRMKRRYLRVWAILC